MFLLLPKPLLLLASLLMLLPIIFLLTLLLLLPMLFLALAFLYFQAVAGIPAMAGVPTTFDIPPDLVFHRVWRPCSFVLPRYTSCLLCCCRFSYLLWLVSLLLTSRLLLVFPRFLASLLLLVPLLCIAYVPAIVDVPTVGVDVLVSIPAVTGTSAVGL